MIYLYHKTEQTIKQDCAIKQINQQTLPAARLYYILKHDFGLGIMPAAMNQLYGKQLKIFTSQLKPHCKTANWIKINDACIVIKFLCTKCIWKTEPAFGSEQKILTYVLDVEAETWPNFYT